MAHLEETKQKISKALSKKIKVNCAYCNKEIWKAPCYVKTAKNLYCNRDCQNKHYKGMVISREKFNCAFCGQEIERQQHKIKASKTSKFFCSYDCHNSFRSKIKKNKIIKINDKYSKVLIKRNDLILEFLIDSEDIEKVSKYVWQAHRGKGKNYYARANESYKNPSFSIHRLIMNPPKDKVVHHINGSPQDNRKENLLICTQKENMAFTRKVNKNLLTEAEVRGRWHEL